MVVPATRSAPHHRAELLCAVLQVRVKPRLLALVACHDARVVGAMMRHGAVPALVRLLNHANVNVRTAVRVCTTVHAHARAAR